jgi:gamma-glutamyltranspeptidase/glutathione hydrolase
MTRSFQLPGRSAVYSTRAMIATSHPMASLIGLETMRRGGSAVDAALAAVATLCVVEPAMTGIGGDCFAIVAKPGRAPVAINGSGRAPAGVDLQAVVEGGMTAIADNHPLAVTIPGAVDAWLKLHVDYGRLPLADVLEPAAAIAEAGYVVAPRVAFDWSHSTHRLARNAAASARFTKDGGPWREGEVHAQPQLAATLRGIGAHGRAGFYEGEVAADMVATLRALGGDHTLDDFAAQAADYVDPIGARFHGHDILEHPPNGQGATALLMLKAIETWPAWRAADAAERAHLFIGLTRKAYALRNAAITDPDYMRVRLDEFLGDPAVSHVRSPGEAVGVLPWETDTTCLSVVDADGMAVSFINSLFLPFGSTILAAKSGVMFHCRGTSFSLDPSHPNALAPRKRPMHTIIPGMVMKDGRAVAPFGVMGGDYQSAGHAHLLARLLEEGMDLQDAIDAPRTFAAASSVQIEEGYDRAIAAALTARGHILRPPPAPLGGAQAVWIDHQRGVLIGGSDPRKDGCALGY